MMEATVAVIFIVYFASNGAPVESDVPDQEKFHNLFNSVAEHNQVEFYINREGLREQAIHERQAFDSMKDALRITPRRRTANHENPARNKRDVPPNSNPAAPELTAGKEQQVTITSVDERQHDPASPKSEEATERLPERDADWQTIRTKNFLYIDKTPYLLKILQRGGKLYYVTRPRRFGKSLFIDMAADYFRGKKDKFKGLAVEDVGNTKFLAPYMPKTRGRVPKWKEFPVIHLNFGQIYFETGEEFTTKYHDILKDIAREYGLDPMIWSSFDLRALITGLCQKFNGLPVIILVDEYDHPFQHAFIELKNETVAKAVRTELNGIFTIIKNNVCCLRLALVTGVSKLGSMALESTDAFVDLTYDEDLAEAFGFTELEITSKLGPNLKYWARNIEEKAKKPSDVDPVKKIMQDLRDWYDGYQFAITNDTCRVFNPISTIQSVKNRECKNYWTSTGSLKYLVDRFYQEKKSWYLLKKGVSIPRNDLFIKIDLLKSPPSLYIWMLLFGYYTISSYDKGSHLATISFPNKEIADVVEYNIAMYMPSQGKFIHEDCRSELSQLNDSMLLGDTAGVMKILKEFVLTNYKERLNQHIPCEEATRRLALILRTAGVEMEDSITFQKDQVSSERGGDIDLLTLNLPVNYIFETKCSTNLEENALKGLGQQMGYLKNDPTNFSEANRKMRNYKIVSVNFLLKDRLISLVSWIAVPCADGFVQFPDTIADPEDLRKRFLGNYVDKQSSEYIKLRCGPELPILT